MKRVLVALLIAAFGATASAPAPAVAVSKPKYCKKKPSKLTKRQRRRCRKKRGHSAPTRSTTTPPLSGPVVPPVVDPPVSEPVPTDPGSPTAPLGRLGVRAEEFKLTLSRSTLAPGDALVELQNAGEDAHDLRIVPSGGGRLFAAFPETAARTVTRQRVTLPAGNYLLYCGIGDHSLLGMRANLTVAPSGGGLP